MGFFESERGAGGFCDRLCTYYVGNQMKFNFYISCDTAEEAISCVRFIERMATGQKTWEDQVLAAKPKDSGREIKAGDLGKKVDNDSKEDSHPTTRPNISPGEPTISKIGSDTKDALINALKTGVAPDKPHKWVEHYKLLWKRGEVKFDGESFYL